MLYLYLITLCISVTPLLGFSLIGMLPNRLLKGCERYCSGQQIGSPENKSNKSEKTDTQIAWERIENLMLIQQDKFQELESNVVKSILELSNLLQQKVSGDRSSSANIDDKLTFILDKVIQKETKCPQQVKAEVRPELYRQIGSNYYYIENQVKLSWFGAAHRCVDLGGHLLNLKNQAEYDALRQQLQPDQDYWTDVTDLNAENEYVSLTTGRVATFLVWAPGEPNHLNAIERCVHIKGREQKMNDRPCSTPSYFVCQI
ncbi:accessory gland protein Acp29AB-like [Drosophila grimshawi]|uniref:accessory gland protein Acp29AB-like n=1 Tax=Drosophila grimshawi TaxID=7222 RepID=UPI0013EF0C72|nr:accessory gland protein Acp29AB-like [Drosophila grimshawi]